MTLEVLAHEVPSLKLALSARILYLQAQLPLIKDAATRQQHYNQIWDCRRLHARLTDPVVVDQVPSATQQSVPAI